MSALEYTGTRTLDNGTTDLGPVLVSVANPLPSTLYGSDGSQLSFAQAVIPTGSPFAATTVSNVFDIDTSGYGTVVVALSGTYSGVAMAWESTIDGTNWFSVVGRQMSDVQAELPASFSNTGLTQLFPCYKRFRLRLAAISTGTVNATVLLLSTRFDLTKFVTTQPAGAAWQYAAASGGITDTASVAMAAAAGAGVRNYLTSIDINNTHATVDTEVVVKDGTTVIWRSMFKALSVGARAVTFPQALKGSTNTALNVACITTGSATYVNAQGYTGA